MPALAPGLPAAIRSGALTPADATRLRSALVACSVAGTAVAWLVASGPSRLTDPELALLLRGMAALKALIVAAAFGLVWWRLGRPVSGRAAVAYAACVGALCAGTVLIWQLAFIPAAAVLFHAALFGGLFLALREGHEVLRFGRR